MSRSQTGKKLLAFAVLLLLSASIVRAADESYIQLLSGKLKKGDSCTVIDDKFLNLPLEEWNRIRNLSVNNYIIFELRQDTNIFYYNKSFTCTLSLSVKYFKSRDQLEPNEINNINLVVRYDTATGKYFPVFDQYVFKDAYKVTVVVNSITSPEWGAEIPAVFRVRNQIIVQRIYPFTREINAGIRFEKKEPVPVQAGGDANERVTTATMSSGDRMSIAWEPVDFPGFQLFDVEWTFIDIMSPKGEILQLAPSTVTTAMLDDWMRFDNTRVTVSSYAYTLNTPYADGFVLARVRGVAINATTGIRQTTSWQYCKDISGNLTFQSVSYKEAHLNWQYVATFAEGGMRKEVYNVYDGTFRSRQTVTINNTDNAAVIAETVYDKMGRPAVSILPAPLTDDRLGYYSNENRVGATAFTHDNINPLGCSITAPALNNDYGAAKYYSSHNGFLANTNYYFTKYIPDAQGYPYSLTEYTPDNTGRIRRQSGVGEKFRMGNGYETQYFYGKPTPGELYRLFGMEVGNASHYLKNMVIDPNGQITVSYLNSGGKIIATALAGESPDKVDALPSGLAPEARKTKTEILIRPQDFQTNAGALMKEASATFLAAVKGPFVVNYSINAASLGPWNGPVQGQQFCSNCYYDIEIVVKDDCGNVKASTVTNAFQLNSVTCNPNAQPFTGALNVDVQKFGEHTVTYKLRLNEDVIKYQTDYYISNNIDLKTLQTFFHEEMILADLKACYSECSTCIDKLGTLSGFTTKMTALLQKLKDEKYSGYTFNISSPEIQSWITTTYNSLLANCQAMAASCAPSSPCEAKLEIMKNDVRPGGQYLLFDETFNIPPTENGVSIINNSNGNPLNYKNDFQITNFEFTDEDGVVRHIKDVDVTNAMFIKAYMAHPEWADDFVKRHIEYCSYLWCKSGNNEASYTFDEHLRENINKGSDAVAKGYYNDMMTTSLLDHPQEVFFKPGGAGYPYYDRMRSDLNSLSAVLGIRFKDQNGNNLPHKNIIELIYWMLYCKPNDPAAPAQSYVDSWNNCFPASNCRSLTSEWELYRNYYLKMKSKYVRLAKLAANPNCENCFIGPDVFSSTVCEEPGPISDYPIVGGQLTKWIRYKDGTLPFKGNYKVTLQHTDGSIIYLYPKKGTYKENIPLPENGGDPIYTVIAVVCLNNSPQPACDGSGGGEEPPPCPTSSEFHFEDANYGQIWESFPCSYSYEYHTKYYVHTAGPVNQLVNVKVRREVNMGGNISVYEYTVQIQPGQDRVDLGIESVEWNDNNCNWAMEVDEMTYVNLYVWEEPTCGAVCPPPFEFMAEYNNSVFNPCWPDAQVTVTYTGSTPLPPGITYADVYMDGIFFATVGVNNSNGFGSTCVPMGPVGLFFTVNDVECQFDGAPGGGGGGFTCPTNGQFTTGWDGCLSDGFAITAAYTGSGLPFPANKKVTVTAYVTFTNGSNATTTILLNNYSGTGVSDDCVGGKGWNIQSITVIGVTCENIVAPPSSTCAADPRAPLYATKYRVWNEYVDEMGYMGCLGENAPTTQAQIDAQIAASIAGMRMYAIEDLDAMKENWIDRLRSVVADENANDDEAGVPRRFGTLADPVGGINATITTLVNNLYLVAKKYIEIAPQGNIRAASTLPPGVTASNGFNNFSQVFTTYISSTMIQNGFGPHLLEQPYPYDKSPVLAGPNVTEIPLGLCARVTAMKTRWNNAGNPNGSFHGYLQAELGDDYKLTATELTDLETRCAAGCKYLNEAVQLPAVFADPVPANPYHPWVTCAQVNSLYSSFAPLYPNVVTGTKLHRTLLTNYLNTNLGYALGFDEYEEFKNVTCVANGNAVLYNKPVSRLIQLDHEFLCVENIMRSVFDKAGQEYEYYIETERRKFRNAYISKCLSSPASASLYGEQYEYHYTLYYYDHNNNLIKTIPPEGVAFLSDQDIATIGEVANQDPMSCTGSGIPNSENVAATFTVFSNGLQANTTKAVEMWFNNTAVSTSRQIRFTTPDNKYFLQAAIHNKKLWVEIYTIAPGPVVTLANRAAASLLSLPPLQQWTHVLVQSSTNMTNGALQLFVDGQHLTNYAPGTEPAYPFAWGAGPIPAQDIAVLKHMRMYNRTATDAEATANYRNACLAPVGALAVQSSPLQHWGRFNIPAYCSTNSPDGAREIANNGSLYITGNGPGQSAYTLTSVANNFTVELWVNPQQPHEIDQELQSGWTGISGQRYAIHPTYGDQYSSTTAGMGISVGTNGVSVYEHGASYMPALLVWSGTMTGWNHIAVVYQNKTPHLYINGQLVRIGLQSTRQFIHPSYNFGGSNLGYGAFTNGRIDEVRMWNVARTAQEISTNYNKGLLPGSSGSLVAYWPMNQTDVGFANDVTCNNLDFTLVTGEEWSSQVSPVLDKTIVEFSSYFIVPDHTLATTYAYNSLEQMVKQTTPDGGTTEYYYDRLGRLTISQNAEQKQPAVVNVDNPANRFSYTRFDLLGRVIETGEKLGAATVTEGETRDNAFLLSWLNSGTNRQVTVTAYDEAPAWTPGSLAGTQHNLRKRVTASAMLSTSGNPANPSSNRVAASYYSYDIIGNVKKLVQENTAMAGPEAAGAGLKTVSYEYELASGKVTKVLYQDGKWDQFYYHYKYDADSRVISAWSARLNTHNPNDATDPDWRLEATYRYHLHGPLARTELSRDKVQGIDYAYTLQGWLKGVNGQLLDPNKDIGGDGKLGNNSYFIHNARDVFAFSLGYYTNDYIPIDAGLTPATNAFGLQYTAPQASDPVRSGAQLFNGNISYATYAIKQLESGNTIAYSYRYDQLHRLKAMNKHNIPGGATTWNNSSIISDYAETVTYDANGNIKNYNRNGYAAAPNGDDMDVLTYGYNVDNSGRLVNNRLRHVKDQVTATGNYLEDIENQVDDNYQYDNTGNLVHDEGQSIDRINWNVQGKIASIRKMDGRMIYYDYDMSGNRVRKLVERGGANGTLTTFYVRDAQGNVLAVYTHDQPSGPAVYAWKEQHLYGTSRLGMATPNLTYNGNQAYNPVSDPLNNGILGVRIYELTNHLGNVLVTISDVKVGVDQNGDFINDYYQATVLTANDYYPFGMIQPGRKYTAGSQYRYGYNGKEGDTEMGAEAYDYGSRIYDARIGKWLSIDPLTNLYPMYTPYHYAGNNPILFIDRDGEDFYVHGSETEWAKFKTALENSYGGLITLERDKKTNKVTMHVSQKKVDEMNKKASKSGDNALAKIKLKEQYAVIFNADKHKKSTKIKLADTDAEKKSTWGGAFRGGTLNGEYQVIDMDDLPILSKDSKVMTQLGNIIHEVREAFEDQAVQGHPKAADKAARDAIFDKAHAQALKSQAKVDGWDVVYSRILEGYYIPEFGNGAKHIQMFGGKKNKKGEMEYTLSVIILTRDGKFVDIKNFKVDKVVIKDGVVASFNIIK